MYLLGVWGQVFHWPVSTCWVYELVIYLPVCTYTCIRCLTYRRFVHTGIGTSVSLTCMCILCDGTTVSLTCMYMRGIGACDSTLDGHHAAGVTLLCKRALCGPWSISHSLDAVIFESGMRDDPLTNSTGLHGGTTYPWNTEVKTWWY